MERVSIGWCSPQNLCVNNSDARNFELLVVRPRRQLDPSEITFVFIGLDL
jgi:hypothetical protein